MTMLGDEMKAHALEAQKFSRKHLVLELDFSEASVAEMENQADSVPFALKGGKSPENIALLTRLWGAYVGEALRRATGAQWTEETAGEVRRIGLQGASAVVHPHEHVHKRLLGSKEDNLVQFFRQAREQLVAQP